MQRGSSESITEEKNVLDILLNHYKKYVIEFIINYRKLTYSIIYVINAFQRYNSVMGVQIIWTDESDFICSVEVHSETIR